MRVVSLACSNTEIVCALGCADLLVGVDDHSDYPEEVVSALPHVGPDLQIDVERVAELRPDLVLATLTVPGHEVVVEKLEKAGLPFIAPEPVSLDDVYRDVIDIGTRLGVEDRAHTLVADMKASLAVPPASPDLEDRPSLLVQWWPKPSIVPGRLSWTTDIVTVAGGRNPLGQEEVKSRPVSDDEVCDIDPDGIVISWCGVHPSKYRPDVVLNKPEWADLKAIRAGHVFCVAEAYMGRPGPRLVDGARELKAIVRSILEERDPSG